MFFLTFINKSINTVVRKNSKYNLLVSVLGSLIFINNLQILFLLLLINLRLSLVSENEISNGLVVSFVGVVFSLADLLNSFKSLFVLGSDVSEGNGASLLESNELPQSRLGFDNAVRNLFVSAEMRQPKNEFNWVDIGSNDNQLGFLLFNQSGNVAESGLQEERLLLFSFLLVDFVLSFLLESFLLFLFVFRLVLLQQGEKSLLLISAHGEGELVNDGWDLESVEEDFSLSLKEDVLRPFDVSGQISLWLNVSSNLVVSLSALEEIFVGRDFLFFFLW